MAEFVFMSDDEAVEYWRSKNLSPEDYNDSICFIESKQKKIESISDESKLLHIQDEQIDFEEDEEEIEINRYEIKIPEGFQEIELYDNHKCFDENFEIGADKKYILLEINKNKEFALKDFGDIIPNSQTKCIIDIEKVEDFSSLEFISYDYDTLFGLRLLSFIKYKSDFFTCDERVMFEAMLIKFRRFDFKPFYWSFNKIYEELGIKKDRATKIIKKLISLGIISQKLVKTFIDNRPLQINYYDLNPERILSLISSIYHERENVNLETEIKKYLFPSLKKKTTLKG